MGKDRDRGKAKGGRGGDRQRMFIANEEELEIREREVQQQKLMQKKRRGELEEGEENAVDKEENEVDNEVGTL